MYKIKLAGIYIIEVGEYYYIGKSVDIFSRWSSHYTSLKMGTHSSKLLQDFFNREGILKFNFRILENISKTKYKQSTTLKGAELEKQFNRYLLIKEKEWMSKYSINMCLNQNNKNFS
jgi:hypothetical protein